MPKVFTTARRVEFCETDAAGIAHFASLLCYMEQAEHSFWRSLGKSVVEPLEGGYHLSWPRVHVSCDYKGAARFEDELTVTVEIEKLGTKSITYRFTISSPQTPVAVGKVVAVCCRVKAGEPLESQPIPPELSQQLREFVADPE
ncbi:MAG TPA: 4-hydroxybenzoyl-CoA thioesterase [Planctomycetaceae bacterium]|nr:4-hydroxybenzoyl-CoA thioesterase [Planctomycetaceae bacterium]